jgi:hypothetical protein
MMRRLATVMGVLLMALCASPVWSASPAKHPVTRHDIGATLGSPDLIEAIPPGNYFAVLFLRGDENLFVMVCNAFRHDYDYTLSSTDLYAGYVYFPKKSSYTDSKLNCATVKDIYASRVWNIYDPALHLGGIGDGPILMIIRHMADGTYANEGYVDFSDASDAEIADKFSQFDTYYLCGPAHWDIGREIDLKANPVIASVVDVFRRRRAKPCSH